MALDSFLLYVLVSVAYIASPGPAVFIAINGGAVLGVGRTAAVLTGNTAGLGLLAFISAIGVGDLILGSVKLTAAMQIFGALWLAYLAVRTLRAGGEFKSATENRAAIEREFAAANGLSQFKDGLVLAVTNPKPIIFFISIYPQFITADDSKWFQFLLLGVTFTVLSFVILNLYSLASKMVVGKLLGGRKLFWLNYFFGGLLFMLAVFLLAKALRLFI